jgi:hypothetical protein
VNGFALLPYYPGYPGCSGRPEFLSLPVPVRAEATTFAECGPPEAASCPSEIVKFTVLSLSQNSVESASALLPETYTSAEMNGYGETFEFRLNILSTSFAPPLVRVFFCESLYD